jgi:hemerythrin-like domain-containing protein
MLLLDELRAEHARIDAVLGALRTFVARRVSGEALPGDGARFVSFFRTFADRFHHAREEGVLFPAIAERLEVPATRGPLAMLARDHAAMRGQLSALALLLDAPLDDAASATLRSLATAYTRALWLHIDAEESVLFGEAETRLARAGVRELPTRPPTEEEARARDLGEALVALYPPSHDPELLRGDGCVICPHYGEACDGLEHEWWNDHEWEEAYDRFG